METWTCDECGEPIKGAKAGWLEWYSYHPRKKEGPHGHGLRIVHHNLASPRKPRGDCYYSRRGQSGVLVLDNHLDVYLGPNGLMKLLSMIYDEVVPTNELLEVIKRLHIPGYEEARHHFADAIAAGVYEPNTPPGFPHTNQIEAICRFANERSDD